MRVFGLAEPPYAFFDFCERMPAECDAGPLEVARIAGNSEQMAQLDRVNRACRLACERVAHGRRLR
jgi:predicted transglutaminase-like cysteine proteinase